MTEIYVLPSHIDANYTFLIIFLLKNVNTKRFFRQSNEGIEVLPMRRPDIYDQQEKCDYINS